MVNLKIQIKERRDSIPRSHTWNLMLLYCTVSTLNPIAAAKKMNRFNCRNSTILEDNRKSIIK
jgi:hypothetical protein